MPALPILTFHALEERNSVLAFPPRHYEFLLTRLHDAGWHSITLGDAVTHLKQQRPFPLRSFVLTFDDGYESVYTRAFPILMKYGFSATVFLTTGANANARLPSLNGLTMLRWNEIRAMHEAGIAFGAHTLTHPDLTQLDDAQIERELRDSQAIIADALGADITTFAYPFGRYDTRTRAIAARYFACACSDKLGLANTRSDLYTLERVDAYYLRDAWISNLVTSDVFPWYIRARNVPRELRRAMSRPKTPARG